MALLVQLIKRFLSCANPLILTMFILDPWEKQRIGIYVSQMLCCHIRGFRSQMSKNENPNRTVRNNKILVC